MCMFEGEHGVVVQVAKNAPIRALKLYRQVWRGLRAPYFGKQILHLGAWYRATRHGFYALKTDANLMRTSTWTLWRRDPANVNSFPGDTDLYVVQLAGRVRIYEDGYRAEWVRIVRRSRRRV